MSKTATRKPANHRSKSAVPPKTGLSVQYARRRLIGFVTILLFVFGLVMVASASSGEEMLAGRDQWALFRKQAIFGITGLILMWGAMKVPLETIRKLGYPLVLLSCVLMIAVMIPGVGYTANGATRWINLGFFQLQPSEPMKLAIVIMLADHLTRHQPPRHWITDFWRSRGGFALILAGALVTLQSDLGSGFIISIVAFTFYVLIGTRARTLANIFLPLVALLVISITMEEYRLKRFLSFLNPWENPEAGGYQLIQSLVAIGSGGVLGVGLGHSVQKISFLPEAHTDMIFAVIAEELGLVGVLMIIGSFGVLALTGVRVAMQAKHRFSALLALGITTMIIGQALTNIGGVVGLLPLTGVPLPLVSYGGSSLLVTLTALGLLANCATEKKPARRFALKPPRSTLVVVTKEAANSVDEETFDDLAVDDDFMFDDDFASDGDSYEYENDPDFDRGGGNRRASRTSARDS